MSAPASLSLRDCAILLAASAVWGANTVLSKIVVDLVPPLAFLTVRFAIVVALVGWMARGLGAGWRTTLLVVVLTGPVHFGFQFVGFALAGDLSPLVIAMQLWIPFSVLFAAIFLKEVIAPARLLGIVISFLGIAVMAFDPVLIRQLDAFILVGLAAAAYAGASVIVSRAEKLDPLQMQVWVAIVSLPSLAAMSAMSETGQVEAVIEAGWFVWFTALFAGVLSGLAANAAMWTILQRNPVSAVTPWLQLSPVIGVLGGILVLGDTMTAQLGLGMALSLAGVIVVALARKA